MIVTGDIIKNFNPCNEKYCSDFDKEFPNGIDISPLYGGFEEASKLWLSLLSSTLIKSQIGWCIFVGLLPARIRANLSGANLSGADLRRANLSGANISGADLRRANLSGANISWANLSGANLSWANISWADLRGADLRGVDLRGVDLSRANIHNIITNKYTS